MTTIGRPGELAFVSWMFPTADPSSTVTCPDRASPIKARLSCSPLVCGLSVAPSAAAARTMPATLIAAPAAALIPLDLGAMTSLYHFIQVNVQLLQDFSGSYRPVAVAALARGC
jgi:hypothetical protein